jgi:uncharacterized NAD(P)/FAD-binding protein YdhS
VALDIAVVGAGASGILVALHLLRADGIGRITLIEKGPVGEGVAYSTKRSEHLLNVVAARMSLFEDDPGHFTRYLAAESGRDAASFAKVFAERRVFSRYLVDTLEEARRKRDTPVEIVRDEVVALREGDGVELTLASGTALKSDAVVLALGNWPRAAVGRLSVDADRVLPGWAFDSISRVEPSETICIGGTGLSMVDAVLTLASNHHRGAIHVVSRHGLMPLPHAGPGGVPFNLDTFMQMPLLRRVRRVREVARDAVANGMPWQWVMDTLRSYTVEAWQSLSIDDQRRFLRHVARQWDVHRHRIPESAAATVEAMQASGQLRQHRGRLSEVRLRDDRLDIAFVHHSGWDTLRADRIIDCSGLQGDIRRVPSSLVAMLIASGAVRPGRHGIGLETTDRGAIVGADGIESARMFAVGSVRIGERWESVAVPDLRQQAATVAEAVGVAVPQSEYGAFEPVRFGPKAVTSAPLSVAPPQR